MNGPGKCFQHPSCLGVPGGYLCRGADNQLRKWWAEVLEDPTSSALFNHKLYAIVRGVSSRLDAFYAILGTGPVMNLFISACYSCKPNLNAQ